MPDSKATDDLTDQSLARLPVSAGKTRADLSGERFIAAFEVFLILLLFFSYAGWPPPHINEAHYLAKAKHFWNPQWCARDLFLQSRDAHVVFFWSIGWLTKFVSLTATAWIGRFAGWTLLAIGWRQLSTAVAPGKLISVLTAAWLLILLEYFHMSGEWIVGGIEGKAFAYAFVWFALAALVRERWKRAWIFFGLATAFHAIVGVWATLAGLIACLTHRESRAALPRMFPSMAAGALIAAPSIIIGLYLDHGATREVVTKAARVMVHGRLKHHLAIHEFPIGFIVRFSALAILWLPVSYYVSRNHESQRRVNRFVMAALGFAIAGAIIDQALLGHLTLAARILKYYWYRLADAALPMGVALTLAAALVHLQAKYPKKPEIPGWLLVLLMLVPAVVLGTSLHHRRADFRPPADRRWDALIPSAAQRETRYQNWRRVCHWVRRNTPADALFITPRSQQTFKWYAERAEVVNWKDVPQDSNHVVEWDRRNRELYSGFALVRGITAYSDARILRLADKYKVQYLLVERGMMRRTLGPSFRQVYPAGIEENSEFAVFEVVPADERSRGLSRE